MTEQLLTTRAERGQTIAQKSNQVQRIDENFYTVKSQSGNGEYAVTKIDQEWICECPDNKWRHVECKHIHAVEFSLSIRAKVSVRRIKPLDTTTECVYCHSDQIVKNAVRHNKAGDIQRYICKACSKRFSVNLGFEKMRATPQVITSAMQLYFTGESFRNVMKFLKLQGVQLSHVTVLRYVRKYTNLMEKYLETMKPNVSDTWRADELYIKMKGDLKYLFAVLDDETRFWISQEVAETKEKHDARQLFITARRLMGKQPKTIITDGLPSYSVASKTIFPNAEHIRKITFNGKAHNNNKMERFNGEVRDREKTMRGLKKNQTTVLKGYQIFHNYIRPHEGLGGKTPSEACGIKVEGENKWLTLIQNARKEAGNLMNKMI